MSSQRPAKRPRCTFGKEGQAQSEMNEMEMVDLIEANLWDNVVERAQANPSEVIFAADPSPLAIACRMGAPLKCVEVLLDLAPHKLRHVLDSRGTPLHEAIVCESTESEVVAALLRADEKLGNDTARATLLQDVDGFTPLHLLIRRRFQSHILQEGNDNSLMLLLEMLVSSCPEAVIIPDLGEYEEPPIVYAIKANIYSPAIGSEEETLARVERQIYDMIECMLKFCPKAASTVFSGYRGQYTALHSAVFHGRCPRTIGLLLETEAEHPSNQKAALLSNTQGELPLHFCAMRGERPRSVTLLANAAPAAVLKRDASGLTPVHWIWIRFVSTLLALDDGRRAADSIVSLDTARCSGFETNKYNEFSCIEQDDSDNDLQIIKKLDPPVDFLRMRHIPMEVLGDMETMFWASQSLEVLKRIRERFACRVKACNHRKTDEDECCIEVWNRQEAVVSLFWTKVVALLNAAHSTSRDGTSGEFRLVHTAFASPCCPPSLAFLAASLFSEEMMDQDEKGRLPIHYAASRPWHNCDWPREGDTYNEPTAAKMLHRESLSVLRTALRLSPHGAVRVADKNGRLVLHEVIDTFISACAMPARSAKESPSAEMTQILKDLIRLYPESLQRRDGKSKLYPFLQATASAAEHHSLSFTNNEVPLSITYQLLRENPTLLSQTTHSE